MSAFPSVHYPAAVPPRSEGCDPYEAFGCIHSCDIRPREDGLLHRCSQYNITNDAAVKLVPAGACVPFLPPNEGPSIPTVNYEDYVRRGAVKKQLGMNIEEQVLQLYQTVPECGFGPICDMLSKDDHQKIMELHVPTTKERQTLVKKNKLIIDAVSSVGVKRTLLHQLLSEETHGQIERMYHDRSYYSGCLSFESLKPKSSTLEDSSGLLFYPSGQALDTLNIHVLESESVPCFKPSASSKTQFPVTGCIRQIDTHISSLKKEIFAGIRTDYHGYVVRCKRKENLECKLIHDVTSQYRITSLSISPHLDGEFLFSNEKGQVIHVDKSKNISTRCPVSNSGRHTPAYTHFTSHPRLAFVHTKDQAYQLDFRVPNLTETEKIPLFQLPINCLPVDQYFCVARQHPSNPFYHCLATQHYLFLMDERFPQHSVLQWPHLLSSPPNYLHITPSISSPSQVTSDDLIMAASYSSREVHCFQSSSLCGEAPSSSRGPWKIQDSNAWLDMMSVVPSHDEEMIRERITSPLIGLCTAKLQEDQQQTVTVFQISEVGDVSHQVLKVCDEEEFIESVDRDTCRLSEPCERKCRDFVERVIMSSKEKNECEVSFKKIKTKKLIKEITKYVKAKSGGCCICQPGTNLHKGRASCEQCGLAADQSSSLSQAYPRGVLTLSKSKYDHLPLSLLRSVSKGDAERCKLGKRLWNMWHTNQQTADDKRGKSPKLIKAKKKKKPVKRLQKTERTSAPTSSLRDPPSRLDQDGIRMSQEDREAMLSSGTSPTLVLDRLLLSNAGRVAPSLGEASTHVQNVVASEVNLNMSVEKLQAPILNRLDTPESPRSLSSVENPSLDIVAEQQQQEQEDSPLTEESPIPQMTVIRRPKKPIKKKSHTMGF